MHIVINRRVVGTKGSNVMQALTYCIGGCLGARVDSPTVGDLEWAAREAMFELRHRYPGRHAVTVGLDDAPGVVNYIQGPLCPGALALVEDTIISVVVQRARVRCAAPEL